MAQPAALKQALEMFHMPSRVRPARAEPLADGVLQVLLIAAGDEDAIRDGAEHHERPAEVVRQAAAFFIEQILLASGADSYRLLGADRDAPVTELRRNMALLLRFLHPDLDRDGKRSMFAGKVIGAWDDLKSPERRAAYDDMLQRREAGKRPFEQGAVAQQARWRGHAGNSCLAAETQRVGRSQAVSVLVPERRGLLARTLSLLAGRKP